MEPREGKLGSRKRNTVISVRTGSFHQFGVMLQYFPNVPVSEVGWLYEISYLCGLGERKLIQNL